MNERRFIASGEGLPEWSSTASHAVVVNGTCWVSGQLSISACGKYVPGSAAEEATRAFDNVFAALDVAGFAPEEIVYVDIALLDLADFPAVNDLFAKLFPVGRRPARTVYQAAALPFGGKIKVVAIATKDSMYES